MLSTKFRFIWLSGFRGEDFIQKSTNQKQELPVAVMFINGSGQNEQSQRGPSIDASYQVSVHKTDDGRWMPSDGKSSHCLWQGELIKKNTFFTDIFINQHCELPSHEKPTLRLFQNFSLYRISVYSKFGSEVSLYNIPNEVLQYNIKELLVVYHFIIGFENIRQIKKIHHLEGHMTSSWSNHKSLSLYLKM